MKGVVKSASLILLSIIEVVPFNPHWEAEKDKRQKMNEWWKSAEIYASLPQSHNYSVLFSEDSK